MPALARGDKTLPVGDREIDRRQRPGAQDRARDDDAGGGFLMDHEIGADREHRRLQHHAQAPWRSRQGRRRRRWRADCRPDSVSLASLQRLVSRPDMPIATSTSALRRLVAARSLRRAASVIASRAGVRDRNSVIKRQRHQDDGADQSGDAEQPVKRKADRQIERQPGQIEERARPHAAEKRADIVEIAQRLQALVAAADHQRQAHHGVEHAGVEGLVERGSDAAEDATADQVEAALGGV